MKAYVYGANGAEISDVAKPAPKGTQVLVKVQAVAVNPIDTYIRAGAVAMNLTFPFVIGADLAGVEEDADDPAHHAADR